MGKQESQEKYSFYDGLAFASEYVLGKLVAEAGRAATRDTDERVRETTAAEAGARWGAFVDAAIRGVTCIAVPDKDRGTDGPV